MTFTVVVLFFFHSNCLCICISMTHINLYLRLYLRTSSFSDSFYSTSMHIYIFCWRSSQQGAAAVKHRVLCSNFIFRSVLSAMPGGSESGFLPLWDTFFHFPAVGSICRVLAQTRVQAEASHCVFNVTFRFLNKFNCLFSNQARMLFFFLKEQLYFVAQVHI